MKKFLPLILVVALLAGAAYFLLNDSAPAEKTQEKAVSVNIGDFNRVRPCSKIPEFLTKNGIKRPIIDLSQMQYKGIAFYFGNNQNKVLHKKEWEVYDALGTYTIDNLGNIYLTPNPFISIKPETFNLQKAIYKLDSKSGKLERWMVIDDVEPNQRNPYGLISILFDCKDGTLWVSSLDKSDYKAQRGRIYHIDTNKKEIIEKFEGFDALTINWLYSKKGRFLIAGSARDNGVYAFALKDGKLQKPVKLFEIPNPRLRVRKIKVIGANTLKLEAIKFNYSLIAETNKKQRTIYIATYKNSTWQIKEQK